MLSPIRRTRGCISPLPIGSIEENDIKRIGGENREFLSWLLRRNHEGCRAGGGEHEVTIGRLGNESGLLSRLFSSGVALVLAAGCLPELKRASEDNGSNSSGAVAGVAGRPDNGELNAGTGGRSSSPLATSGGSAGSGIAGAVTTGGGSGSGTSLSVVGGASGSSSTNISVVDVGGAITLGGLAGSTNASGGAPATVPSAGASGAVAVGGTKGSDNAATGGVAGVGGTSSAPPDTIPPELQTKAPLDLANPSDVVQATFTESIDCSSVTSFSFLVKDSTAALTGTLSCSGNTVTFAPRDGFTFTASYSVTLTGVIKDAAGNSLKDAPQSWTFKGREGAWDSTSVTLDASATGYNPSAVINTKGDAMVAWGKTVGTVENVWSNRYTESTGKWSGAMAVYTDVQKRADDIRVGADDSGNFIAAWSQGVPGWDTIFDAVTSRIVPGDEWSPPKVLSTDTTTSTRDSSLMVQPSGDAVLIWLQRAQSFSAEPAVGTVWGSRFSASSNTWSNAIQLSTPCDQFFAAADPRGVVMVMCNRGMSTSVSITWKPGQLPTSGSTSNESFSAIQADTDGNFRTLSCRNVTGLQLWADRWSSSTATWGTPVGMDDSNGTVQCGSPAMAVGAKNAVVAIWLEDGVLESTKSVMTSRHTMGGGTEWLGNATITSGDLSAATNDPSFGIDAAGNAVAAWARTDGDASSVWASRFLANGYYPAWSTPFKLNQNAASGVKVATHPTGRTLVVWTETESATSETSVIRARWFR